MWVVYSVGMSAETSLQLQVSQLAHLPLSFLAAVLVGMSVLVVCAGMSGWVGKWLGSSWTEQAWRYGPRRPLPSRGSCPLRLRLSGRLCPELGQNWHCLFVFPFSPSVRNIFLRSIVVAMTIINIVMVVAILISAACPWFLHGCAI